MLMPFWGWLASVNLYNLNFSELLELWEVSYQYLSNPSYVVSSLGLARKNDERKYSSIALFLLSTMQKISCNPPPSLCYTGLSAIQCTRGSNQVAVVAFQPVQLAQASFLQKNQMLQNLFLISVTLRWHRPSIDCKNQSF